jgi:large subunit ribosomal protein L20
MPRVKRGYKARRRRKKVLDEAHGYFGGRSKLYRTAMDAVRRAWLYQYRHRKERKREFRRLWNVRIGAAARLHGMSYSRLIHGLKTAGVEINRKMLAEIAIRDPEGFTRIVDLARDRARA